MLRMIVVRLDSMPRFIKNNEIFQFVILLY